MTNLEVGDEAAYAKWKSKYIECWEYAPVGNPLQFNYNVKSSYQKITAWGGFCGNGFILEPLFFVDNVNGMSYLDMLNEEI